jgi:hypothetical protein
MTIARTAQAAARERVVAFIFASERGSPSTFRRFDYQLDRPKHCRRQKK